MECCLLHTKLRIGSDSYNMDSNNLDTVMVRILTSFASLVSLDTSLKQAESRGQRSLMQEPNRSDLLQRT